jgi:uncharacterized protein
MRFSLTRPYKEPDMQEPELIAISLEDTFQFACHCSVPCFNDCCRDLNQALSPYDVLRLRKHLGLSWPDFLSRFAEVHTGPVTGLPVVSLRFSGGDERNCPFVTDKGCRVYDARPTSCRLYPLARALRRNREDGGLSVHYALLREPHCRGFEQSQRQTVRLWIASQDMEHGLAANDDLMALIARKNSLRPGPLSPTEQHWLQMALYDPDGLKTNVVGGRLEKMTMNPPPLNPDDRAWLAWGLVWIQDALFR